MKETLRSKILKDIETRSGKSPEGSQDEWVLKNLNYKRNGFFVDCGAAHFQYINNTYILETKYNWDGICIEPNTYFFETLSKNRKCTCLNIAVSSIKGELPFINRSYGSSLLITNFHKDRKLTDEEIISVKCDTLNSILDYNIAPTIIDYLNLDIPGSELDVVKTLDFNKYKFLTITIKRIDNTEAEITEILSRNGYTRQEDLYIDMAFTYNDKNNYI